MHGVAEHRSERRFERARRVAVERDVGDAKARGEIEFARQAGESLLGAVKFEPAGAAQIALRPGLGAQRVMLADRARK